MDPLINIILTIAATCVAAYITIRILVAEMKKDIAYLKADLDRLTRQREIDTTEMKKDIKEIGKTLSDIRVSLASALREQKNGKS